MILMLFLLSIALSVVSESASQLIYFVKVRRKLSEAKKKPSFDWLPQKRKALVSEYIKIVDGNKNDLIWGQIVLWLYCASWIFLITALMILLILYLMGQVQFE